MRHGPIKAARLRPSLLFAALLAGVLVAIWALLGVLLWQSRVAHLAKATRAIEQTVRLQQAHGVRTFEAAAMALSIGAAWIADHPGIDPRRDPGFAAMVEALLTKAADLRSLSVIDPVGQGRALGARGWSATADVSDRDYVRAWDDRADPAPYVGAPVRSRADGRWVLPVSLRIAVPGGHWILGATIAVAQIEALYRSIADVPSAAAVLVRRDGTLLVRMPFVEADLGRSFAADVLFTTMLPSAPQGTYRARSPIDGVEKIISYAALPRTPVVVVASIGVAEALATWKTTAAHYVAITAALTVIVLAMAVGIARLMRRRERLMAALAAARDKAEASSTAKSAFLANMSHELRTPLNAIIGFSEVMALGAFGAISDRYRSYAQDIHLSGKHLLALINGVLDLSRCEAGRLDLAEERVSLAEVVESCHRVLREQAAKSGVSLTIEIAPGLPAVWADATRLKQILINLLSNAVKFTPAGGTVRLAAAIADRHLVITVADSGIGMSPEQIPLALEPFRQVDSSHARRYEGSGLGLPLARRLVELHGGTLAIASASGVGTTVTVRLPPERVLAGTAPAARETLTA